MINFCSMTLSRETKRYLGFSDRYGEAEVGRIKDDWMEKRPRGEHCFSLTFFISHIEVSGRTDPVKAF